MIDIIIPAYNAHEKICESLISIAMQTICDKTKVYIVNDASDKDYSEEIDLFKDRLDICELKLEKNGGPGVARQYGIDNTSGKYILFLDSDDLLYNKFSLEKLYNAISGEDFDYAVGGMLDEQGEDLFYYTNHMGCLHGKMYKREYIKEKNIYFNDTRNSEDNSFNKLVILSEPKVIYVHEEIYLYRYNPKSITSLELDINILKAYIYNALWVVEEAKKRDYNKYLVSEHIFMSLCYIYAICVNNINWIGIDELTKSAKELVELNNEYAELLNPEDRLKIYSSYKYSSIPEMSLNEFCNKCLNSI